MTLTALVVLVLMTQLICVIRTDGDGEVDFNDVQAVQQAFYRLAVRQAGVHQDILDVQRQQLRLQQQILDLQTRHPSVLTDMVLYTAVIFCVYLFVKFMKRYGFGVVVCLFIHYCSRIRRHRHQVAEIPRMPPSVQVELRSSTSSDSQDPQERIRLFGVKNFNNHISAV